MLPNKFTDILLLFEKVILQIQTESQYHAAHEVTDIQDTFLSFENKCIHIKFLGTATDSQPEGSTSTAVELSRPIETKSVSVRVLWNSKLKSTYWILNIFVVQMSDGTQQCG